MCLLTTVFAAIVTTVIWYINEHRDEYKLGLLTLMFWGASIMWFVDAVVEYIEDGAEYFMPAGADMLNDLYLGISVIALGLIIWMVSFLIADPKGVIRNKLIKNS